MPASDGRAFPWRSWVVHEEHPVERWPMLDQNAARKGATVTRGIPGIAISAVWSD